MKNRVLLLMLTLALLITCAAFTASASGEETNTFEANFVCPCGCGDPFDEITWRYWGDTTKTPSGTYKWNVTDTYHYLVEKNLGPGSEGTLTGAGEDGAKKIVVVFHKSDSSALTFGPAAAKTYRMFTVPAGTTAYIVGDNATLCGPCPAGVEGGLINIEEGASLRISGSTTLGLRSGATSGATNGGLIYNKGTLTLNDTTLNGITVTGNGGAIWSSGDVTLSGSTTISGGSAVCGGNIHMEGAGSAAAVLTIQDTVSVAGGIASRNGGNISLAYSVKVANMTMTGGTVSGGTSNGDGTVCDSNYYVENYVPYLTDYVYGGGNIFVFRACTATISGGTVSDGTAAACGGGNVFVQGTLNVSGAAKLTGGTAIKGGNIYAFDRNPCADSNNDDVADSNPILYAYVNISGGEVTGGAAVGTADVTALGGTIYAYGGGKNQTNNSTGLKITGGTVGGGTASGTKGGSGGAIYVSNTVASLSNCTVNGGTATRVKISDKGYGGIYQASGTVNMKDSTVISGGNAYRGGCVYLNAGTFNMESGSISGGDSSNKGGQVYVAGTFNMKGGTVTANPADTDGAPGFRVQGGTLNLSGDAVVVSAGSDVDDAIDVVTASKTSTISQLTLAGSATVKNKAGNTDSDNIINMANYVGSRTKLTVKAGWSGKARTTMDYLIGGDKNNDVQYAVGMVLNKDYAAAEGDFSGELILQTAANQPPLIYNESGALQVCPIRLCTYNLPKLEARWFTSATAAAEAAQDGDYVDIYAPINMDIGAKDVLVDFNGNDCTVTGTGKLYMMDAAGDEFSGTLAKINYNNVATSAQNPYNDNQYIALSNVDGTYSAHRIDLRISAVSVRPGCAGVYYTAALNCDDALREKLTVAGVAVSLNAIPDAEFKTNTLYTEITALNENEFTGVLINEILKDGEDNDTRGKSTIYANAYATFTVDGNGVTVLADTYNAGKTKGNFQPGHTYTAYSLSDVMNAIDLRWRNLSESAQTSVLNNLYNNYGNVMHGWDLQYMVGQVKNLKVLTIGNSLSVDAGHMLGYIAKIEGMEHVRFSTLYYGGCTLRQHVNFLTSNTTEYRWYDTDFSAEKGSALPDAEPEDTVPYVKSKKKEDQITMYEGITKDNWDIIVLQQGVFDSAKPDTYGEDLQTLIDYVRKHATNPNMVLMWNMIWAGPVADEMVDRATNGTPPDSSGYEPGYESTTGYPEMRNNTAAQNKMFELIREAVQDQIVDNDNFIAIMPSGTAQQNALWSGLTDQDMYRDYIHASDLARYIYSYVWYCTLTDAEFDEVASDTVPMLVCYQTTSDEDLSELPSATADMVLDEERMAIVNHSISSALSDPFTPKAMTTE